MRRSSARSCSVSLVLDTGHTKSSQLWDFAEDNSLHLDHLRDGLSGSVLALGCTSSAFGRLMLISPAQQDPGVDLAAALAKAPCC